MSKFFNKSVDYKISIKNVDTFGNCAFLRLTLSINQV